MSVAPLDIPEGYRIGPAERGYLAEFEALKRQGVPMTPADFYRRMKKPESTFARYKVLKAALNEYGWRTKPAKMRGPAPALLQKVDIGPDPAVHRLEKKVAQLSEELKRIEELKREVDARDEEIAVLRSALMATVTHFAPARMSRATEIERELVKVFKRLLPPETKMPFIGGGADDHPSDSSPAFDR